MSKRTAAEQKNYHHGDLKKALLEETAAILREEGEASLSLRRLAANLGVSRTAPYNHFENKDALLSAVAEEGFRRFESEMRAVRHKHRRSDGREFFRAMVQAYVNFAVKQQEYYDLMYSGTSWRGGSPMESLATTARKTLRDDIERMKRAQDEGLFSSSVDVAEFVQIYWGTLHGISRLTLDGVYSDPKSLRKLCNATADMLWRQLDPSLD